MLKASIRFIVDSVIYSGSEPLELIPGYVFRKANVEEIELYKRNILDIVRQARWNGPDWNVLPYEHKWVANESGNGFKMHRIENPEEFKYYLVEGSSLGLDSHVLGDVLSMLTPSLRFGAEFMHPEEMPGLISRDNLVRGFHLGEFIYFSELTLRLHRDNDIDVYIDESHFSDVGLLWEKINALDRTDSPIYKTIREFLHLEYLPYNSKLRTLGFFVVIESLIAHNPKSTETGDSISHQIKTKIPLLMKRFKNKVVYPSGWNSMGDDKIWSLLYSYRSKIAHGDNIDFNKEFKALIGDDVVIRFISEVTRKLLIQSLVETELIMDLRRC